MRIAQAAEFLDVSTRHVEKLLAAGELEGVNVAAPGARRPAWRCSVRSVRSFLERRALKAARNAPRTMAGTPKAEGR